ncbi:MAG: helix-turn-helix transcriptional regulator [Clostridium butyricum]|nr:helix-turn-helix transcriptional regulator [Clostridium butyricum]MDU4856436.1 helix-turn-helix transcriptional regulator [Clostridioides difficile]
MELNLKKLKIAQAKACLSTNELVEKTKLSRSTISKVLNGTTKPSIKSAGLIAKALDVDITEII